MKKELNKMKIKIKNRIPFKTNERKNVIRYEIIQSES